MAGGGITGSTEGVGDGFLEYHEPGIQDLLVLISFFFFLSFAEWISDKLFKVGLIGQIVVGILYGVPIGNIMPVPWQKTFVSLGYIGLVLIIFEGGLTVRLDLLKRNYHLSMIVGTLGVIIPVGLCYAVAYVGFGYGPVETFIVSAALSPTSLGTTFVVIASAAKGIDFDQTKVGTVLISAAVLDDITGLIMASVIHNLGPLSRGESINLAWAIARPIATSIALGILSPLSAKYLFSPIFRLYFEHRFMRYKHISNIVLMIVVLCAFLAIAGYAGTSVLFGAFLAGTFLSGLPCVHPDAPFMVFNREHGESSPDKTPNFIHTFEKYFLDAQQYVLQPMFFASVGFTIPFRKLWTGEALWKGMTFTLVMMFAKVAVGFFIPIWDSVARRPKLRVSSLARKTWKPALLLGMGMAARGEIGLLIIQIGLNETTYLSEDAFVTAAWAIILSTIIGPISVGLLLKYQGQKICNDSRWGMQQVYGDWDSDSEGRSSRWTSRRHSRAVSIAASRRSSITQSRFDESRDDVTAVDVERMAGGRSAGGSNSLHRGSEKEKTMLSVPQPMMHPATHSAEYLYLEIDGQTAIARRPRAMSI